MDMAMLGELGANAATAEQIAPGMFSFKPSPPTAEELREQAAADARNEPRPEPPGFDMSMIPDLSLVHRAMIPGVWNRVRMGTFPENWVVLGFDPDLQEAARAERGSHTQVMLEAYGHGGLPNVIRHLRADALQFCGFRVSMAGSAEEPEPEEEAGPVHGGLKMEEGDEWLLPGGERGIVGKYVFMMWVGEEASAFTRKQAAAQLLFFRDYFHHADVELVVAPPPGVPLDGKELQALIGAQLAEGLASKGFASAPEEVELDFSNRDAPKTCTHYDWEIAEGDGKIGDLDALTHALQELETAYADVEEEDREAAEAMMETTTANLGLKKGFLDEKVNSARTDTTRQDTAAAQSGAVLLPAIEVAGDYDEDFYDEEEEAARPPTGEAMETLEKGSPKDTEFFSPCSPSKEYNASAFWGTPMPFFDDEEPTAPALSNPPKVEETAAALELELATLGGTGAAWIADCCEQWRYIDGIEQQVLDLAGSPERLSELVKVGEITDASHPAYQPAVAGVRKKAYLAYAGVALKEHTVLGWYGGVTKTVAEAEAEEAALGGRESHYGMRLECTVSWGARAQLEIDGAECGGNELGCVNDYRTDLENYDKLDQQTRGGPNAKVCEVWIEDEPMPRACFVTTKRLAAGEEITIDYSNGFWATRLANLQAKNEETATEVVAAADRRAAGLQRMAALEKEAFEALGGSEGEAARQEARWAAEQAAKIHSEIARIQAEMHIMQDQAEEAADEMIDLSQETLKLQHEADREATYAKLVEGAGGAKQKLAARLAAKKAAKAAAA